MPNIQHTIVVNASVDQVRSLVSTADGFAKWWAEDVVNVPGINAVELGFFNRHTVYRLTLQPQADAVRWRCDSGQEWAGTTLVFHLTPKGQQTEVDFSHEDWAAQTPYFISCNTTWGHLMFKLKDAAEHDGPPRPLFTKTGMESSSGSERY